MRVAFFFTCLLFLLLRGSAGVHACPQASGRGYLLDMNPKQQVSESLAITSGKDVVFTISEGLPDTDYLFTADEEDEDANSCSTPKNKFPARNLPIQYHLAFPASLKQHPRRYPCRTEYFGQLVLDRCIRLRVLRL